MAGRGFYRQIPVSGGHMEQACSQGTKDLGAHACLCVRGRQRERASARQPKLCNLGEETRNES